MRVAPPDPLKSSSAPVWRRHPDEHIADSPQVLVARLTVSRIPAWRGWFIAGLEQSFCVKRSAERAGISTARAYRARGTEPEFVRASLGALAKSCEW